MKSQEFKIGSIITIREGTFKVINEGEKDGEQVFDIAPARRGKNAEGKRCWKIGEVNRWIYPSQVINVIRY